MAHLLLAYKIAKDERRIPSNLREIHRICSDYSISEHLILYLVLDRAYRLAKIASIEPCSRVLKLPLQQEQILLVGQSHSQGFHHRWFPEILAKDGNLDLVGLELDTATGELLVLECVLLAREVLQSELRT